MSRTDKDRPYRVKLAEYGVVEHDHRFGPCDFDPEDPQRDRDWRRRYKHWVKCNKRVKLTVTCEHSVQDCVRYSHDWINGFTFRTEQIVSLKHRTISIVLSNGVEFEGEHPHCTLRKLQGKPSPYYSQEVETYREGVHPGWVPLRNEYGFVDAPTRGRMVHEYTYVYVDSSIACECDEFKSVRCYLGVPADSYNTVYGNPRKRDDWFYMDRPARSSVRQLLHEVKGAYNANPDDDFDPEDFRAGDSYWVD